MPIVDCSIERRSCNNFTLFLLCRREKKIDNCIAFPSRNSSVDFHPWNEQKYKFHATSLTLLSNSIIDGIFFDGRKEQKWCALLSELSLQLFWLFSLARDERKLWWLSLSLLLRILEYSLDQWFSRYASLQYSLKGWKFRVKLFRYSIR